jgi:hypothetical protein
MPDFLSKFADHKGLTIGLTVASVVMFVGSLALLPWLVSRAPTDFFTREAHPTRGALAWVGTIAKNLFGLVALVLGVLMLFLPGQGVLMVLLGITMLDFPGKKKLEQRIVKKDKVWRSLSWLRRRAGKPEFERP